MTYLVFLVMPTLVYTSKKCLAHGIFCYLEILQGALAKLQGYLLGSLAIQSNVSPSHHTMSTSDTPLPNHVLRQ